MQLSQFYRQQGLVDQERLKQKNILISGSTVGISNLLVLLDQVGFGHGTGIITIMKPKQQPSSPFFDLHYPNVKTWDQLEKASEGRICVYDKLVRNPTFDYHLSVNSNQCVSADLYSYFSGPRARLTRSQIPDHIEGNHIINQAISVISASAMIHQMLTDLCLIAKAKISDAWITVTCRIESTEIEEASNYITGLNGQLLDFTPTSDGLALLARYRIREDINLNPYKFLNREMETPQPNHLLSEDIGLIDWNDLSHAMNTSWNIEDVKLLFLGAGALGSWSIPLFADKLLTGSIEIVDGDDEIELHNLNRQVLYTSDDIGKPKADVAKERIGRLNPNVTVQSFSEYLNPGHVSPLESDIQFDELDFPASNLSQIIKDSDIYFSCLDNMLARKVLSDAATMYDKPMINGATEGFTGIVEQLGNNDGCMVCRYGRAAATSTEVISCTEEGVRPTASIVTSSAWTGAMMAVLGMVHLSPHCDLNKFRYSLDEGFISSKLVGKPPWFNEDCIYHI